jgi:hypothetical protein
VATVGAALFFAPLEPDPPQPEIANAVAATATTPITRPTAITA